MIGKTIGHYRIESKLGEGGMGVVYRAVDTRLDRLVALKVLQPDTLPDIEHKRRFVQEARAASALNHPNIVTIYEIGRADDVEFIAMEYVPGHALDELIARGPMALPEVLRCAIEIADALGKAHAAGIIHRDLKPANVMLTLDGSVKLLDFGLAKHIEIVSSEAQTATHPSPAQTQKGIVIGTLGYMSPEQAQGKALDARSDIFSFGALVYELVTGRSAFFADTQLATLSAILHDEPKPITDFVRTVPQELERIIRRCLRKDPNRRFHHILDVKVALQELNEEAASRNIDNAKVTHSIAWPWRWILPVVGIALFAVVAAFWLGRRERTAPLAPFVTRLTSDSGLTTQPALSSDGKLVAYASDRSKDGNLDIWVQQVPSGEAIQLTRDPADDSDPDFAPDGQRIVFRSERNGGGIYVISSLGGAERLIAPRGQGPRFSPDGTKIAYWVGARGGYTASEIRLVNASGGPERPLQIGTAFAQTPVWSPDGKYLLFLGARDASVAGQGDWDWWVYGLDEGQSIRTGVKPFLQQMGISRFREPGIWLPGGRIVFSAALGDSTNLWELSLSKGTWQVEGTPQRVTTGAGPELHPAAGGKGQIVFANEVENLDVWWLPVEASAGIVSGDAQRATDGASSESTAIISADGSRLTFISDRSGNDDVWMKDLRSGSETAVTMTPSNESSVATDRDGARIAYNRVEDRQSRIYVVSAAQPGVPDKVCDDCGLLDASSDGTRLLYTPSPVEARISTINLLNLSSGEKMRLLEHPIHTLFSARFSHDGSWVSFHEFTGLASRRIYVARLRGTASIPAQEWVPITDGTGLDRDACWAPDGNLLFFFSERDGFRCIWAQRLEPQTKRPVGEIIPVYHMHHARRSIRTFDNLAVARLSTAPGKLVFSMGEYTGNIWMQSPQQR